jgi:hypothetical protein
MNKGICRRNMIFVYSLVIFFQCICYGQWSADPSIQVSYLYKQYDQDCFHISQTCRLQISAIDRDTYCGGLYEGNYVNGDNCKWYAGGNSLQLTGISLLIYFTHFMTNQVGVYAYVNDDKTSPGGSLTDDADDSVYTPTANFQAWELKCTMSISGGTSYVVTESGYGTGVDGTEASDAGSISHDPVTANTSPNANDDGPYTLTVQKDITWKFEAVPDGAITSTAVGYGCLAAATCGSIYAETDDEDLDPLGGGTIGVNVSAGPPPAKVGISITPGGSWELCESRAAIAFGIASNILDSVSGFAAPIVAKCSGNYTNDGSASYNYTSSKSTSGPLSNGGFTNYAQILIQGYVDADGYLYFLGEPPISFPLNSSASVYSLGNWSALVNTLWCDHLSYSDVPKYIYP